MSENINTTLQIVNIILTALSPVVIAIAYCIRRIHKSKCCNSSVEMETVKSKDSKEDITPI